MLATLVGLGVGAAVGNILVRAERRKDNLYKLSIFRDTRNAILKKVTFETGAANAMVLKIHNGGSKLIETEDWYSSVVDEAPTVAGLSAIGVWQNIIVDTQYRDMVRTVRQKGRYYLDVEAMPQSFLKRNYARTGIKGSLVMQVYQDDHFFYYCSFAVRDFDKMVDDLGEINRYEIARLSLMRLYEKYHQFDILRMDWSLPD